MPFEFKIWDQGHDGRTMGIRVADVAALADLPTACSGPDLAGNWSSLTDYLDAANIATGAPPVHFSRLVDVIWLSSIGYGSPRHFPGRTFVVTYTGLERSSGGFASQGYCVIDAQGFPSLSTHDKAPLSVEYVPGIGRDVMVVLP